MHFNKNSYILIKTDNSKILKTLFLVFIVNELDDLSETP